MYDGDSIYTGHKYTLTANQGANSFILVNGTVFYCPVGGSSGDEVSLISHSQILCEVPKSNVAINFGDVLYYRASNGQLTKTSSDVKIGIATSSAVAGDSELPSMAFDSLSRI